MMGWQAAVVIRLVLTYVLLQIILKSVVGKNRRTERLIWQFACAAVFAVVGSVLIGGLALGKPLVLMAVMGVVVSWGTFFNWKAVNLSQTRTSLFTFWDDIIAIFLSCVVLNEIVFITVPVLAGIVMSFTSIILFILHGWFKKVEFGENGIRTIPPRFYGYVAIYSLIWGFASFLQRYWAVQELSIATFTVGWYLGTTAGAVSVHLVYPREIVETENDPPISVADKVQCIVLGLVIYLSLVLALEAYKAPQVVVQPLFLVAEMILPSLVGLFIYHERKQFDLREWLFFAIGFAGALMVGLSF